jgi:hypothetical protein
MAQDRRVTVSVGVGVALTAAALAWVSARPYAGCWNDGSRLATVECLVDHHTLAIDHSVFVKVPRPPEPAPYPADETVLLAHGTQDKLFVAGHFYSDKSPVPAVLLAGVYKAWEWWTGRSARTDPAGFCRVMTLASSGLAFVLTVIATYVLGGRLGLSLRHRLLLTAGLALSTVALPYARHVNNHILLLGVAGWMVVAVAGISAAPPGTRHPSGSLALLGLLAGVEYTIDLGAGPVLLVCTGLLVLYARPGFRAVAAFGLAALPWLVLHHALNYAVGGTWGPANAVQAYLRWPGSPFNAQNMTGGWAHPGPGSFLLYSASMLFGKRGFVGHNLPLFLVFPAAWMLRGRWRRRPETLWALACCAGTWLLYAAASNNSSGRCLSIRWFVPLLAPGFYLVAVWLKQYPRYWVYFLLLSVAGFFQVLLMGEGPWSTHMVADFWLIQAVTLLLGATLLYRREGKPVILPTRPRAPTAVAHEAAGPCGGSPLP